MALRHRLSHPYGQNATINARFILLSDTLGVSSMVDLLDQLGTESHDALACSVVLCGGPPVREQARHRARHGRHAALVDVWVTDQHDVRLPQASWIVAVQFGRILRCPAARSGRPVLRARFRTDDEGRLRVLDDRARRLPDSAGRPVGEISMPWPAPLSVAACALL